MAKKNYSKMSTENVKKEDIKESLDPIAKAVEAAEVAETVEEAVVEETVKEPENKVQIGVVCNCVKLNVRNNPHPNAHIELTIDNGTEVEVTGEEGDFYSVRKGTVSEGFTGWCMKKFIKVKE